jgi:hypothetical protein
MLLELVMNYSPTTKKNKTNTTQWCDQVLGCLFPCDKCVALHPALPGGTRLSPSRKDGRAARGGDKGARRGLAPLMVHRVH